MPWEVSILPGYWTSSLDSSTVSDTQANPSEGCGRNIFCIRANSNDIMGHVRGVGVIRISGSASSHRKVDKNNTLSERLESRRTFAIQHFDALGSRRSARDGSRSPHRFTNEIKKKLLPSPPPVDAFRHNARPSLSIIPLRVSSSKWTRKLS